MGDQKSFIKFQSHCRLTVNRRQRRIWCMWPKTQLDPFHLKVLSSPNLVHEEDTWWQLHRVGDPLLDQELFLNIVRFCLCLNISLAYSCLRLVPLINFPDSSVAGVGEPKCTEFEQLLLVEEAVAITSQTDSSSKWCCHVYRLEQFLLSPAIAKQNGEWKLGWPLCCAVLRYNKTLVVTQKEKRKNGKIWFMGRKNKINLKSKTMSLLEDMHVYEAWPLGLPLQVIFAC